MSTTEGRTARSGGKAGCQPLRGGQPGVGGRCQPLRGGQPGVGGRVGVWVSTTEGRTARSLLPSTSSGSGQCPLQCNPRTVW